MRKLDIRVSGAIGVQLSKAIGPKEISGDESTDKEQARPGRGSRDTLTHPFSFATAPTTNYGHTWSSGPVRRRPVWVDRLVFECMTSYLARAFPG